MIEFEKSIAQLGAAERAVYENMHSTGVSSRILDHSKALLKFKERRDAVLAERLGFQGLEICGEVQLHGGASLAEMGVLPSDQMQTVRIESEIFSVSNWPETRHVMTSVKRVCPDHALSIPRRGTLEVKVLDPNQDVRVERPTVPERIFSTFGLQTLPIAV